MRQGAVLLGVGTLVIALALGASWGNADGRVDRLAVRVDSLAVSLAQVVEAVESGRPAPPPDTIDIGTLGMTRGSPDAPVTMVEFLDYECPFCQKFHTETMPKLIEEYVDTGKLRLVLRDNPLDFHEYAMPAARAVRCAGEQGDDAYWRLSDALVSVGTPLDAERVTAAVAEADVDAAKLVDCLTTNRHDAAIAADASAAVEAGLTGTPMFIVGPSTSDGSMRGRVIRGAYPIETFRAAIDEALTSAAES